MAVFKAMGSSADPVAKTLKRRVVQWSNIFLHCPVGF